jgi:hypothetical protein
VFFPSGSLWSYWFDPEVTHAGTCSLLYFSLLFWIIMQHHMCTQLFYSTRSPALLFTQPTFFDPNRDPCTGSNHQIEVDVPLNEFTVYQRTGAMIPLNLTTGTVHMFVGWAMSVCRDRLSQFVCNTDVFPFDFLLDD